MATNTTTTIVGRIPSNVQKNEISSEFKKVYGFHYPTWSHKSKGFFNKVSGLTLLKNNLKQLIQTARGERVMLPNYGMNLRNYLFEPLDELTFQSIQQEILYSLNTYEPRVEVVRLRVIPLNEYGVEGFQAINVILTLRVKEEVDSLFEVEVKIQ